MSSNNLGRLRIDELQAIATHLKIIGWKSMPKNQLIRAIENKGMADAQQPKPLVRGAHRSYEIRMAAALISMATVGGICLIYIGWVTSA